MFAVGEAPFWALALDKTHTRLKPRAKCNNNNKQNINKQQLHLTYSLHSNMGKFLLMGLFFALGNGST